MIDIKKIASWVRTHYMDEWMKWYVENPNEPWVHEVMNRLYEEDKKFIDERFLRLLKYRRKIWYQPGPKYPLP